MKHTSAKPEHYNHAAENYDAIYDKHEEINNNLIADILKKNKAMSVLDLTCGTGSQVIHLANKGFDVVGSDINKKMLGHAKNHAKSRQLDCAFVLGDMRTTKLGVFDSVITIFNSIGHLTRSDFKKTLKNINSNLKPGGIYIFDIFNLDYMLNNDNITKLTIDQIAHNKENSVRKIQYSTVDSKGILASYTTSIVSNNKTNRNITKEGVQTLQIYNIDELKDLLSQSGFSLIKKSSIDGAVFNNKKTKHMLLVAKKNKN